MTYSRPKLAVVGAGISGLICARQVRAAGWDVTVYEKSRGVGGRMGTRRADDGLRFDHGAQYFTVRDAEFERYVQDWVTHGSVAVWDGVIVDLANGQASPKPRATPRFIGVPGMNAVCKHLATGLDIQFQTRVVSPRREGDLWRLRNDDGESLGEFDCFVTSAPAPQSADLLASAPELQQLAQATTMSGCWAAMVSFPESLQLSFDGAFVHESPLSWIACNNTKLQRDCGQECWVLHASPAWTNQHIEDQADIALVRLIDTFWQGTGATPRTPSFAAAHRWRYAIPPEPLNDRCLFDAHLRIGACGDWCNGPRVEGAFLSGMAMADRVLTK
ncbi:MAG: NAD(P)/FAD-dependent oxidoreductase [Pirellulales bacterium]